MKTCLSVAEVGVWQPRLFWKKVKEGIGRNSINGKFREGRGIFSKN